MQPNPKMHETYKCLEIDGVDVDVTIHWVAEECGEDYYIGDAHVWRSTTEYRISHVESDDEIYDFEYAPLTAFEVAVSAAYQQNHFEP